MDLTWKNANVPSAALKPIRTPRCAYIVVLRWRRPPLRHSLYRPRGPLPLRLPPPRLRRDLPLVPRFPLSRLIRPLWGNSHKRRPRLRLMARRPMELLPHRVIPNTVSTADGRWPRELRYVWAAACRWVRVPASAPIAASRPIPWPRSASIAAAISTTPPIRSRGANPRWRPACSAASWVTWVSKTSISGTPARRWPSCCCPSSASLPAESGRLRPGSGGWSRVSKFSPAISAPMQADAPSTTDGSFPVLPLYQPRFCFETPRYFVDGIPGRSCLYCCPGRRDYHPIPSAFSAWRCGKKAGLSPHAA